MIVICQRCQAKFRVPDEKIPARGAKVRCSKCQAVFVVHRDVPADPPPPARDGADGGPTSGGGFERPSPRRASAALDVDLEARPAVPPPLPPATPEDAGPVADPFAPSPPRDDPFAAAALASAGAAEPDPFGAPAFASHLAPAEGPGEPAPPAQARLAVTDLSDLLGAGGPAAPPPLPPGLGAAGSGPAVEDPPAFGASSDLGIALEDRVTPPAFHVAGAAFESGLAGDAFGGLRDAGAYAPGSFDFSGSDGESLALATERTPAGPLAGDAAEPAARPELAAPADAGGGPSIPQRPRLPARAEGAATERAEPEAVDRIPGGRGSPLRAAVVNALALAALVLVALATLVVWRGEGSLSGSGPAALLASLRRGGAPAGPFAATELRKGLYDRERAPPLVFVRGTVVARPDSPAVDAVRVEVELVKEGAVVARGEALAGAVPTPEELWRAADPAALAAVVKGARARAPARVRAGDAVPFLVAIADYPGDLGGATVRVALSPAEAGR
jgi:Meckel syndrome type 1 protein